MARRRRFRGMVSLPLGSMVPSLKAEVSALDVVGGAAAGFVGTNLLDGLLSNFMGASWASLKSTLGNLFPAVAGAGVGAIALVAGKYTGLGAKRATGLFWGAVAYGATATLQNFLRGVQIPGAATGMTFQDVVALPLGRYNYGGLLVDNPKPQQQMGGLLVDNPAPQRSNLAALGQLSMADDYDGMDALASM